MSAIAEAGVSRAVMRADGLRVRLGDQQVLEDVGITLDAGRVHGLIGPNGAGKSTLLRALAHLVTPSGGAVRVVDPVRGELPLAELRTRARARVVGFLPQDTGIDQDFSVRDVVSMGRYAHLSRWVDPSPADRAAVEHAMALAGVAHLAGRSAKRLSGGQRQLVLLAKQLAQRPAVYLLDEPVAALDLAHQLQVMALIRTLADDGAAVVVVLHDISLASRACDTLTVLSNGRVRATGTPERVLSAELIADVYGVHALVEPDPVVGSVRITPLSTLP